MKKILFLMLMLVFVATPVLAVECPFGQHWQEAMTDGYYTDGQCVSMSIPECTNYVLQCPEGYQPSHLTPNKCFKIIGWSIKYKNKIQVCTEQTESICLEYEQIYHEPIDEGMCVENTITPKPKCQEGAEYKGGWDGEKWIGKCEWLGGISIIQTLPKVTSKIMVDNTQVHFLSSHLGVGGLLLRQDNAPTFPIDTYGTINTFQLPTTSIFLSYGICLSGEPINYFGSSNNYGYEYNLVENSASVYHTIDTSKVPLGTYKARAYFTREGSNAVIFGMEEEITID